MLKSYFDISDKNAPIYDDREEVFKQKVFDLFGIKVIQSHYQTGNIRTDFDKRQNYLTVWCDFSSSEIIKKDIDVVVDEKGMPFLAYENIVNEAAAAGGVMVEYLAAFSMDNSLNALFEVRICDFVQHLLNYAYGHSVLEIRRFMSEKYHMDLSWSQKVFVPHAPYVLIIAYTEEEYRNLCKQYPKILKDCYRELKKHDSYGVVTKEAVDVRVRLKSELDKQWLIGVEMTC